MAISLPTGNDYLSRNSGILSPASDQTTMFWVRVDTLPTVYQPLYTLVDDPTIFNDFHTLWLAKPNPFSAVNVLTLSDECQVNPTFAALSSAQPFTASVWMHVAVTQSGTTHRVYLNGTLWTSDRYTSGGNAVTQTSYTLNLAAAAITKEYLGGDGTAGNDGVLSFAYCREWTAALTQAQILVEMQATTAVHTANLYMDRPFTSTILDVSGNGHNWTQIGSATFVAGPSFPANSSAATATAFGTIPQTITQDWGDGVYAW